MSMLDGIRHRLRNALRPGEADHERLEEYALYDSLAGRPEFENATYVKEEVRWMGAMRWVDATTQDLRYAARALRRAPVFTIVAVLSLGLGIGANALIFGTIHTLLLARLPVSSPSELRMLTHAPDGATRAFFTQGEVDALRAAPHADFATFRNGGATRAEAGGTRVNGQMLDAVDGAFFRILGVGFAAGRAIGDVDERTAAQVAVVSHDYAVARFGTVTGALGKPIKLNDQTFEVIGVTRAGFIGVTTGNDYEIAIPVSTLSAMQGRPAGPPPQDAFLLTRFRSDSAQMRDALIAAYAACCANGQLARQGARDDAKLGFIDASRGNNEGKKIDVRAQYANTLYALMAGVAVLLLMACTNVGNLLMARATLRARELAVRLSLGASRARIVRQMMVESMLLAAIGATAGLAVSVWGSAVLSRNMPSAVAGLTSFVAIRPGVPIFVFTLAVTVACALVFGVIPAIRATRGDVISGLRDGLRSGRRSRALDRGIVAFQVGLALLLLTSAGLLTATLKNLSESVGGSNPKTLLAVQIDSRGTSHSDTLMQATVPALHARFAALPGVRSVAESYVVPLIYGGLPTRMLDMSGLEARPGEEVEVAAFGVAPGYFETLGVSLIMGRDFDARDAIGAPKVVVISENLATRFFSGRNPVGEMIGFRGGPRDMQVIGIVGDAKQVSLRAPAAPTVYMAYAQDPRHGGDRAVWAIRTTVDPAQLVPAVRAAILAELPNIRIRHAHPMLNLLSLTTGKERALTTLAIAFGILAVLLAAIGLYGVMAFQVSARTREIGVRMALGAGRGQVVRMVLGQALALVALGVAIGVPLALGGARSLRALLYGIEPFDPVPLAIGATILAAAGIMASLVPSSNAARVDPLVAMRAE